MFGIMAYITKIYRETQTKLQASSSMVWLILQIMTMAFGHPSQWAKYSGPYYLMIMLGRMMEQTEIMVAAGINDIPLPNIWKH